MFINNSFSQRSLRLCGGFFVAALASWALCGSAVSAFAVDWSFTPSVTLSQSYDSNFRFLKTPTPGTSKDDFITSLTPILSVTGETEGTKFQFDTVTAGQVYFKDPRFDTVNTNTTAGLTHSWSEVFSTSANLGLVHDYTLEDQLQTSGIVTKTAERYAFNSGLGCKYDLSELLNLTVSGSYSKVIYPSGSLPGSDVYQGTITPVWSVTPLDAIGLSSNFSYTSYGSGQTVNSGGPTVKTLTEMLFWQRSLSEILSFKLGGGLYLSWLDFQIQGYEFRLIHHPPSIILVPVVVPVTTSSSGFVFSADVKKDWSERFSTTLSSGRQQYNDVSGVSYDSTFFSATAGFSWSELTRVNFTARYNINSEISQGGQKIDYYILSPSIEHNITENLLIRLSGSYEYEYESSGGAGGTKLNLDRFRAWVDLTYKWPRFFENH